MFLNIGYLHVAVIKQVRPPTAILIRRSLFHIYSVSLLYMPVKCPTMRNIKIDFLKKKNQIFNMHKEKIAYLFKRFQNIYFQIIVTMYYQLRM